MLTFPQKPFIFEYSLGGKSTSGILICMCRLRQIVWHDLRHIYSSALEEVWESCRQRPKSPPKTTQKAGDIFPENEAENHEQWKIELI